MTPDELLTTTRSVRLRLDLERPVGLDLIRECLGIALQAPNGGNVQRWRWLVVTDSDLREKIAEHYLAAWHEYEPPENLRAAGHHLATNLARVPVLLIPCLELAIPELPNGNQAGLWASLLPAVWSYMLAARARGLATTWTTLHLRREAEVAELLGLPANVRQGALIPTAHAIGHSFRPARRRPLDEVVHVNSWSSPND